MTTTTTDVLPGQTPAGWGRESGGLILLSSVGINLLSLALPLAILQLYDRIIPAKAVETLTALMLGVVVALMLEALLTYVRSATVAWNAARYEHLVSGEMLARFLGAPDAVLRNSGDGQHNERFTAVGKIKEFHSGQAIGIAADIPFVLLFMGMIYVIGGWIAAIPAAVFGCFFVLFVWRDVSARRALNAADVLHQRQFNFVVETLGRISTIKSTALEAAMQRRYERLVRTCTLADHRVARTGVLGDALKSALGGLTMVAVAAGGSLGVMQGTLSIGELAACTLLANRALQPLQRALGVWTGYRKVALHGELVTEGLTLPGARREGSPPLPPIAGGITLEGVTIEAGPGRPAILKDLSLVVSPGETIGITGAAGTGKTTLLMTMAGVRQPDAGRLLLDGKFCPQTFREESLLGQVIYVSGRAPVFAGTFFENMTMFASRSGFAGRSGVENSPLRNRDRAYELADMLGLTQFAGRLPDGFNTRIGPGSPHVLPLGVAQRIALARAFFAAPRVLLFDAANNALDAAGDAMVRDVIAKARGSCTMVIVSQRPSLLRLADRVLTLADGRLTEEQAPGPQPPADKPGPADGAGPVGGART